MNEYRIIEKISKLGKSESFIFKPEEGMLIAIQKDETNRYYLINKFIETNCDEYEYAENYLCTTIMGVCHKIIEWRK